MPHKSAMAHNHLNTYCHNILVNYHFVSSLCPLFLLEYSFILSAKDSQRRLSAQLFNVSPSMWSTVFAFSGSGLSQKASATNRLTNKYLGYPSLHNATLG
jgi:hypothetical protein